jgi:hypothetical protein
MTYRLHQLLSDQLQEEVLQNLQQTWQQNKAELVTLQTIPPNETTTIERRTLTHDQISGRNDAQKQRLGAAHDMLFGITERHSIDT